MYPQRGRLLSISCLYIQGYSRTACDLYVARCFGAFVKKLEMSEKGASCLIEQYGPYSAAHNVSNQAAMCAYANASNGISSGRCLPKGNACLQSPPN